MKLQFTSLLFLFFSVFAFSQSNSNITGTVLDAENEPALYANVILKAVSDSSLVKGEVTNESGEFMLLNIPEGKYWLSVSYIGFSEFNSEPFDLTSTGKKFGTINLEPMSAELAEVTIVTERPLMEIKPDKVVLNVDKTVNAVGETAMGLLRKSPGVVIDNNDNISLSGKSGVQVYIDGKPSPLSTDDLAAYLKTIPSEQLDAIEIITNPSAKFDAEGNAGIINIKLKKDSNLGANANVSVGYSKGEVAQYNGSIGTNYRNKDFNVYGSYSYYNGENLNFFDILREQAGGKFDGKSESMNQWQGHNFKLGGDYYINKQHTVGLMVNGNISNWDNQSNARTNIGLIGSTDYDRALIADNESDGDQLNMNYNINYQFENGKGKSLNIDADYGQYNSESTSTQPNIYQDFKTGDVLQKTEYFYDTPTEIDIMTFKVDYEFPLSETSNLGFGAKTAFVTTDNTFDAFNVFNGNRELDTTRSNTFVYKENVNAAYVTFNQAPKESKWKYQAGLRMEQTNSEGILEALVVTEDDESKRDYVNFFPSAGLTYQPNQKNTLQLTYSRRINRPSYQNLNPFEDQIDELTFQKGNPFLNPEYTNSFKLQHTFMYFLNTSLSYSHTKDVITQITDTLNQDASFLTYFNIADQRHYSINVSAPAPIADWWSSYTSLTAYRMHNEAELEPGKKVDLAVNTFNVYSQHTFKLVQDIGLEISGWYNSPSIWGGNFKTEEMWSIDAGVQKKLFNGKGNLKLSVSDIFKSQQWSGNSIYGGLYIETGGGWDSRRFKVNFSYMFGNDKVKSRRRNTGLENEKNRIQTENQ